MKILYLKIILISILSTLTAAVAATEKYAESRNILIKALSAEYHIGESSYGERIQQITQAGKIDSNALESLLVDLVQQGVTDLDDESHVSLLAMRSASALAELKFTNSLPELVKLASAKSPTKRDGAIRAIIALNSPKSFDFADLVLTNINDFNSRDRYVLYKALFELRDSCTNQINIDRWVIEATTKESDKTNLSLIDSELAKRNEEYRSGVIRGGVQQRLTD